MKTKTMKINKSHKFNSFDFITYLFIIIAFIIVYFLLSGGKLNNQQVGWIIPVCCYMTMAISLNLTVGILGELSLGHAGFMSIGAFTGVVSYIAFSEAIPNTVLRVVISMIIGALMAAIFGFLIGIPVLRLNGDYLAIVTLAFGEIIKDIINCLYVGFDSKGLHFIFGAFSKKTAADLKLADDGIVIINGAVGVSDLKLPSSSIAETIRANAKASGTKIKASVAKLEGNTVMFIIGAVLVLVSLIIILNFIRSRTGRAVMAIRDNRIAAESVGINVMRHKMIAFVISAALAGAAGTLYAMNMPTLQSTKFGFDTSILVLVFVVLGGLGNMLGSMVAAALLYILPELLREFSTYRMLIYAIVLIIVMLATNNPLLKNFISKICSGIKSIFAKKNKKAAVADNISGGDNNG
ncbi:MAG: branched-chain amino acid ABC transporter permease [Clostridia bacterium]|nr:branched-chain amino acid ABC transporter permease [Clostridia bacterium]